jgi:hypothetical protein
VPVCDPVVHRTVGIVERQTGQFSRAATAFRRMLVEEAKLLDAGSVPVVPVKQLNVAAVKARAVRRTGS